MSLATGDDLVRFLEVAHPRGSYGEEVRDHRRGKWIGLFLQIVERGLHLGGALAKVSEEGGEGTHQRPRERGPGRALQRASDLDRTIERTLQLGARLGKLAALAAHVSDPEIRVDHQPRVALFAQGHSGLQIGDLSASRGERPAGLGGADGGPESNVRLRIADQIDRSLEERDCLLVGEPLLCVLSGQHQVFSRLLVFAGLLEMHRDHGCELALAVGMQREDGFGGSFMKCTTVLLKERGVRRLLHEDVTEEVLELRLQCGDLNKATGLEPAEVLARAHGAFGSNSFSRMVTPNWRPMTEATRSMCRLAAGSRSIRARSSPCSVSGISTLAAFSFATQRSSSRTMALRSMSIRMTSSTKNGLPSALARMRLRVSCGNDSMLSRLPTRVRLSSMERGSRRISVRDSPYASRAAVIRRQPVEARSGRELRMKSTGRPATIWMTWTSASAEAVSDQWMSSQTITAGPPAVAARTTCTTAAM